MGARTSLWLTKATPHNSQFGSALTAEDHSNIPSMDGDTYTEMYFFKFMLKLNQGKFKLLARTVLHPRS